MTSTPIRCPHCNTSLEATTYIAVKEDSKGHVEDYRCLGCGNLFGSVEIPRKCPICHSPRIRAAIEDHSLDY